MGNRNSKSTKQYVSLDSVRARKHCELFVKGMDAALEGRYTESELYFQQIIFKHPKFLLHTKILVALDQIMRRDPQVTKTTVTGLVAVGGTKLQDIGQSDQKEIASGSEQSDSEHQCSFKASLDSLLKAGGVTTTITDDAAGDTVVELPISIGEDLDGLLYLLQVQQDIEHVYIACDTPRAHQLAMVYAQFNCIWMQLFVFFLAQLRMERSASVERQVAPKQKPGIVFAKGENIVTNLAKRFSPTSRLESGSMEYEGFVDIFVDLMEQLCRYYLISSVTNYGTLALNYAANPQKMDRHLPSRSGTPGDEPEELLSMERTVRHKRQIIYDNVLDLCKMLLDMVSDSAEEHPEDYISRVLFKVLPSCTVQTAHNSPRLLKDTFSGQPKPISVQCLGVPPSINSHKDIPLGLGAYGRFFNAPQPTTVESPASDAETSNRSDSIHLLSRMTKLFVAYAEGRGGGTFLAVSRTFSPLSPVALPLRTINLPFRLVVPTDTRLGRADLLRVGRPHFRVSWESTVWTLPSTARFSGHGFPMTSDFVLCNALPEFYHAHLLDASVHDRGEAAAFTPIAVWRGEGPPVRVRSNKATDAYIDALLRYAHEHNHSGLDNGAPGAYGGTSLEENRHMDMRNARMRRAACMDETVTCMQLVYILEARVLRDAGRIEESRASAMAALQQTECLSGPTSHDGLRMHQMLTDMGLL